MIYKVKARIYFSRLVFIFIKLILLCIIFQSLSHADVLTLAWDPPSHDQDLTYMLCYGTNSNIYTTCVDTGNQTSTTLENIEPGVRYYFAATATNQYGESEFSQEIEHTIPLSPSDPDNDGDGFTGAAGDCNDANPDVYPGATDICGDGIDQDCDGFDLTCSGDIDEDQDGYTENNGDCNDQDATIYPGASEICGDGIDQDCDGSDLNCTDVNLDTDNDGLTDFEEENTYNTDPNNADTDGDGFPDGEEVYNGSDPLNQDSIPAPSEAMVDAGLSRGTIDFARWSYKTRLATQFTYSGTTGTVSQVDLWLSRNGTPRNYIVGIWADSGSDTPATIDPIAYSASKDLSRISTDEEMNTFTLTTTNTLTNGTVYWVGIYSADDATDSSNYIKVHYADTVDATYNGELIKYYGSGENWTTGSSSFYTDKTLKFRLYVDPIDSDSDCDVDGADLAEYIVDSKGISLNDIAAEFGRVDCF